MAQRRIAAPVQPAAAAAAALSAATAIPPPTSVQQKLEQLQARTESRYRDKPPHAPAHHHDYHPDDDNDDGQGIRSFVSAFTETGRFLCNFSKNNATIE